jgi:hypothetical protein
LEGLEVVLDSTVLIRDVRGISRATLDEHGWTGIPGLRKAAGSYRPHPLPPGRPARPHEGLDDSLEGGGQ